VIRVVTVDPVLPGKGGLVAPPGRLERDEFVNGYPSARRPYGRRWPHQTMRYLVLNRGVQVISVR
jgi:hypothetical protein